MTAPPAISSEMKNSVAPEGRIFHISVLGEQVTLRDRMVAADLYNQVLLMEFESTTQLILAFKAAEKHQAHGYGAMSSEETSRLLKWETAHRRADRMARHLLSRPQEQKFAFVLGAEFRLLFQCPN